MNTILLSKRFRKATDGEDSLIKKVCSEEVSFRMKLSAGYLYMSAICAVYIASCMLYDHYSSKIIALFAGIVAFYCVYCFLRERYVWSSLRKAANSGNYTVRTVKGYFPVVVGNSSYLSIECDDSSAHEVQSMYAPTLQMRNEVWGDCAVLVMVVPGIRRFFAIPTKERYRDVQG